MIVLRGKIVKRPNKILWTLTQYKKHFALFVMLMPIIAYFAIFKYWPMAGIYMGFSDFKVKFGIFGSAWVGFENFKLAFATISFLRSLRNTLIISAYHTIVGFPAPIIFAIFLNEVRHIKFKRTVQTISYLPHFLSWVVMAGLLGEILSPNTGAVNHLLMKYFGLKEPIYFLGDNNYFRGTLVATGVWKGVGWGSILYLATITSIDPCLYEAAICDGATRMQRIRYITIPCIMPTITIMLILNLGSVLDAGFDQVLNLYNAAVYETGDIIDTYVYRIGIEGMKYSMSTAVGLFKNIVGFILVACTNMIAKRISGNGIW